MEGLLSIASLALEPDTLAVDWTGAAVISAIRLAIILVAAVVLIRLLKVVTKRLVKAAPTGSRSAQQREQQTRALAGILYAAGTALILVVAVLVALPEFGVDVTPIAVAAGLAALALGFGAQHLVRDLISGFFVVFEDQYAVGDVIRVGETQGRVEHLTLRRTVLRDSEGALVTIPNGEIRQVANSSRDWSQAFVDIAVAAGAGVGPTIEAIERASAELREDAAWSGVLVEAPRVMGVESLGPGGTVVRVAVRTAPTRQEDAAREFRRRVKTRFEQEGIPLGSGGRVELTPRKN